MCALCRCDRLLFGDILCVGVVSVHHGVLGSEEGINGILLPLLYTSLSYTSIGNECIQNDFRLFLFWHCHVFPLTT